MISGPAANKGCLFTVVKEIPPFLLAYGAVAAVLSAGQFVAMMFACSLCLSDENHPDDQEPANDPPKEETPAAAS